MRKVVSGLTQQVSESDRVNLYNQLASQFWLY